MNVKRFDKVFLNFKYILYTFLHRKSKILIIQKYFFKKILKRIINDPCDYSRTDEKIFVGREGSIGL